MRSTPSNRRRMRRYLAARAAEPGLDAREREVRRLAASRTRLDDIADDYVRSRVRMERHLAQYDS